MARIFLIASSDEATVHTLQAALKDNQHAIATARDGMECVDIALDRSPHAIFLSVHLPRLDGLRVARALRAFDPTEHVPIIFLAENSDEAEKAVNPRLPFTECVTAPYNTVELKAHAERVLRAGERIATLLCQHEPDITLLAITDPLTHVHQRRYVMHRLTDEASRSIRYKYPLSVLLVDIDNLGVINREHGILMGDSVLIETAQLIKKHARRADLVGRYNTQDFLILMPLTGERGAPVLAERIRNSISEHHFVLEKLDLRVTVSVGVASAAGEQLADYLALLGRAATAVEHAKRGGKNRVEKG